MSGENFASAQPRLVAEELRQVADPAAGGEVAQRRAQHDALTAGGPGEAEQQLDGSRLARAVGTKESEDLAARHGHGEARESDRLLVALRELPGLDRSGVGHWTSMVPDADVVAA